MVQSNNFKTSVSVCLIMKLIYQFLFIVVEKVYLVFYSREDDFVSRAAGEWRIHPSDLEFGRCQGKRKDQGSFSMDENCSHSAPLAGIVLNSF
jgi:hypothetical protein